MKKLVEEMGTVQIHTQYNLLCLNTLLGRAGVVANILSPYEIMSCKFKATHIGTNTSILDIGEGLVCENTGLVLGSGPIIWLAFKNIHST